jgi:dTDP-4-dehydrorhamnose reductase
MGVFMKDLNFLVLGNGFLAQEFSFAGHRITSRKEFDVCIGDESKEVTNKLAPLLTENYNAVVNCIGISDTRYCEDSKNWEEIFQINGMLPGYLSKACKHFGVPFVHISTGCLYGDNSRPCFEDESPQTFCSYTLTKVVGEKGCVASDLIIRPRLLFGGHLPKNRNNLIVKLSGFNSFLDAYNSVTYTRDVVRAADFLTNKGCTGVYNVVCPEILTIHQMAMALGLKGVKMTHDELIRSQNLHLVNNTMSIDKLNAEGFETTSVYKAFEECKSVLDGLT